MSESVTQAERLREVSRRRREQQKENLRRSILDAAAELFVEHGYDVLSMRQIAERIGYSATTIYRYYADKDDLLLAIVHEGFSRFGNALAKAAKKTKDPSQRMRALGEAYIEFGLKNSDYYQLMFFKRSDLLFDKRPTQEAPVIDSFAILRHAVEEGMAAGLIKRGDPVITSNVIWAVVHGVTSLAIADPRSVNKRQMRETTELALHMISEGLWKH